MMPWLADMNIEAPTAWAERAAINTGRHHERAQRREPAPKLETVFEDAHLAKLVGYLAKMRTRAEITMR